MTALPPQFNNNNVAMTRIYEVQIKSLCPPHAYLLVEGHDPEETAELTQRFLNNGSPDDFDKALRVLHLPFDDAIGCGQYEIDTIRPVVIPDSAFPVLRRKDIEALDATVEETDPPVVPQDGEDTTGHGQIKSDQDRRMWE